MNNAIRILVLAAAVALAFQPRIQAFQYSTKTLIVPAKTRLGATVIDAPTKEDLDRKVGRRSSSLPGNDDLLGEAEENIEDALRKQGPLEYLEDNPEESRDMKDPFHILICSIHEI